MKRVLRATLTLCRIFSRLSDSSLVGRATYFCFCGCCVLFCATGASTVSTAARNWKIFLPARVRAAAAEHGRAASHCPFELAPSCSTGANPTCLCSARPATRPSSRATGAACEVMLGWSGVEQRIVCCAATLYEPGNATQRNIMAGSIDRESCQTGSTGVHDGTNNEQDPQMALPVLDFLLSGSRCICQLCMAG